MNSNGADGAVHIMRGSRKFCRRGSKFDNIFFLFFAVGEGIEDPDTAIYWPSSARQQTPFKRCFAGWADDGPTLNAGLVAL